jgi:type III restriction enzyme
MELRSYQETAVKELTAKANELLELSGNKTLVFKAPTGSGKTVMMAEFLKQLIENRNDDKQFSFIWAAPRKLHTQSKEKLEHYYEDSKALQCCDFEDLTDKQIGENEILFLNWESINKADNIYIRENENEFNLSSVVNNTVDSGQTLILVIDESHFAATTETSRDLISMIDPKISIEVSATPHLTASDRLVTVDREKVIDQQMIKKRVALNPGFKNIIEQRKIGEVGIKSAAAETTNELVIKAAIDKRHELAEGFKSIESSINPLLLIQLPDRRRGLEDVQDEVVQILKNRHGITADNGKLAIYLSEDKANLETITKNQSDVEVMIFKQAIALGWDCPRACILVLFRDWKSITFSIQTIGRILRMPELKHYNNDELNTGFVYTNLSDISIQEDIAGSYLTINEARRKPIYQSISLRSVHSKRFREETRLNPQFILNFLEAAKEQQLKDKISIDIDEIKTSIITDGIIENSDAVFEHLAKTGFLDEHSGQMADIGQTEKEVQVLFDLFIRNSLSPMAPEKRSIGRVKEAIYRFFEYNFPLSFEYGGIKAQMVVLAPKNRQRFIDAINRAKEIYLEIVGRAKKELATDEKWEVPLSVDYDNHYIECKSNLSILEPFYEARDASGPEKKFVEYLESKEDEIVWWFKNGQRDGKYFAVPYVENGEEKPFYVDWIVQYKDGRIGLFDTKAGITAKDAKTRAEGLAKYIAQENQEGKKLWGGIVVNQKDGSWRYNDAVVYQYNENQLSGWEYL